MARRPRRRVLVGCAALFTTGCMGPVAEQDQHEGATVMNDDGDEFGAAELERLLEHVEAGLHHFDHAATTLEKWRDRPDDVDLETIDELRIDATAVLSDYWDDVSPHVEDLRAYDDEWAGDGETLADLIPVHERLLREIEDASIAIVTAEGNPDRLPDRTWNTVEFVIDEGPEVVEATRRAIPEPD